MILHGQIFFEFIITLDDLDFRICVIIIIISAVRNYEMYFFQ